MNSPSILFEDNHLLVVNKPSGWIVQGAQPSDLSLLEWGKSYLKQKYNKPGNVFLAAVSRLDREVSGVVPLARTSKSAARLNSQIESRQVTKRYIAVVTPAPSAKQATLTHNLARDERLGKTYVTQLSDRTSEAKLHYETMQSNQRYALLRIDLLTGRKHQIRAQLSSIGSPILGDTKYGSHLQQSNWIALHCYQFCLTHPTNQELLNFTCLPPKSWNNFGFDFSGLSSKGPDD